MRPYIFFMEQPIKISYLNDFIFCPASIYYHGLYEELDTSVFQEIDQIRGKFIHEKIDHAAYSTRKEMLQGIEVYSDKYRIIGKIDIYDGANKTLTERKNKITTIYDGYIFQLYAQYFALKEQGYDIQKLRLYSYSDNKMYPITLPEDDHEMLAKFETLITNITGFDLQGFYQNNIEKCERCIYSPLCVNGGERLC